jgi:hypothetical protein
MGLGTGSTLKQPFTSIAEDYNFIRLLTQYPDESKNITKNWSVSHYLFILLSVGEGDVKNGVFASIRGESFAKDP